MTKRESAPTLLDVNVLVALAWPNHIHHSSAVRWFQREGARNWATCPLTESGFVRVSLNPRLHDGTRTVGECFQFLRGLRSHGNHQFLTDDTCLATLPGTEDLIHSHRHVTDAHLLALARRHGARLGSFDRGLLHLIPHREGATSSVVLISI